MPLLDPEPKSPCLGVVHDLTWSVAIWIFRDQLRVVRVLNGGFGHSTLRLMTPIKSNWKFRWGSLGLDHLSQRNGAKLCLIFETLAAARPLVELQFEISCLDKTQTLGNPTEIQTQDSLLSRERLGMYASGGSTRMDWSRGPYGKHKWSSILPNLCARGFEMQGGNLVALTVKIKPSPSGGWKSGTSTERNFWVGHDHELVDVHPTRGDMVILKRKSSGMYDVVQMVARTWKWHRYLSASGDSTALRIPYPELADVHPTLGEWILFRAGLPEHREYILSRKLGTNLKIELKSAVRPFWTRLGWRYMPKVCCPFEFWDGTLFALSERGEPAELGGPHWSIRSV